MNLKGEIAQTKLYFYPGQELRQQIDFVLVEEKESSWIPKEKSVLGMSKGSALDQYFIKNYDTGASILFNFNVRQEKQGNLKIDLKTYLNPIIDYKT